MHGADQDIIWLQHTKMRTCGCDLRPMTGEMLRYAREDTHYLLYIYDLMKRKLLSSSTDTNCPEASLVEFYQKEILTENSYLNIYGLYDADLNGQQLAIVADFVSGEMLLLVQKMKLPVIYCQTKFLLKLQSKCR
ncbi:putative ribonuclease H-like superfamily [Helianthus debilis subsp. tardiflorus]